MKPILFEIVWSKRSLTQLKEIYDFIYQDSPAGAKKVILSIYKRINSLEKNALIFEADRFKKNNDGTYRSTFIYKYRIVYRITNEKIIILKIMHTSRLPK